MRIRSIAALAARGGIVVVLVLASLHIASPAHASNFGSTACGGSPRNCVNLANNTYHVVRWEGDQDITGIGASLWWAVNNVYNPLDITAYEDNADPYPDVRAWDDPYGDNGILGWVECPTNNTGVGGTDPNRWCRGQILRLNSTYAGTYLSAEANRRRLTCHELGHTLGLKHSTSTGTCMYTPPILATTDGLDAHDKGHINANY